MEQELRDSMGRTEAEFLAQYRPGDYKKPSLTADMAVFIRGEGSLKLLLIRRKNHPCIGRWALPGGFAEEGESIEETAVRELKEETSLDGVSIGPVGCFSSPGRDPRDWVVTQCFAAVIPQSRADEIQAGDDAADARWFDLQPARTADGWTEVSFRSGEFSFTEKFSVTSVKLGPACENVTVTVAEEGGLAFDHSRMIGMALYRLGLIPA